jgi:MFS family permease
MAADMPTVEDGTESAVDQRFADSVVWIMRNGVGIQIMETLAVGAFLTAFAIQLSASNFTIGLLAAVPHLSQLAQIPALAVVERYRNRRKIYFVSGVIARPAMLIIGAAAFIPDTDVAIGVIVFAFALRYAMGAFLGCAWNSWMRDLVPDRLMGEIFGQRQKRMTFIGAVLSLVAAGFVDLWIHWVPLPQTYGYAVIYALAFVGGAYGVWCGQHVYEPPMSEAPADRGWYRALAVPFRNKNFRRLLAFLGSWNFAINLAAPFFTVNMLKRMDLSLAFVVGLGTLSQMAAYLMVSQWGAIADRFSNKSVLSVCAPLFVLCIFAWTFTMFPERHVLTVPLLIAIHIATGIASAGVTLASGNITLKLAPRGDATAYLAASSLVNSLAAGAASMVGGLTADFFLSRQFSILMRWHEPSGDVEFTALKFAQWDFFFLLAAVIGLYALHRLSLVREEGHVKERVVIDALFASARRGMRNLSTVAGLRAATEYDLEALRHGETPPQESAAERNEQVID